MEIWKSTPHRRWNPLEQDWVLVSPQRNQRPWQGQRETPQQPAEVEYDPDCYLCPGNRRSQGQPNPKYDTTFVFDNDFPALTPAAVKERQNHNDLLIAETERGLCRVLCFSPKHHMTVSRLDAASLRKVVDAWAGQYEEIEAREWIGYTQVFENHGEMMGASNPHPHCQIWASESMPNRVARELKSQLEYRAAKKSCLLCDYLKVELGAKERMIAENSRFAAVVPFWAVWPFEVLLMSKAHVGRMQQLDGAGRDDLADILKRVTTQFDNLFQVSFPYTMGFHSAPPDGDHEEWHFHAHYLPPLLRSATVRKFMVGFELLGGPQRDITAEMAAERLRAARG